MTLFPNLSLHRPFSFPPVFPREPSSLLRRRCSSKWSPPLLVRPSPSPRKGTIKTLSLFLPFPFLPSPPLLPLYSWEQSRQGEWGGGGGQDKKKTLALNTVK